MMVRPRIGRILSAKKRTIMSAPLPGGEAADEVNVFPMGILRARLRSAGKKQQCRQKQGGTNARRLRD